MFGGRNQGPRIKGMRESTKIKLNDINIPPWSFVSYDMLCLFKYVQLKHLVMTRGRVSSKNFNFRSTRAMGPLVYSASIRLTLRGTSAPPQPLTFGLGSIEGCLSIRVSGPSRSSNLK